MNKDMINIDDFVREKLGGREEKEDPAAWLRMKELLDKEMPERAIPVGFRFGKPLAFLGCALLATVISVGGYKLLHQAPSGAGNTVASGTTGGTAADHNKTSLSPENSSNKNNTGTGTQQPTSTAAAETGSDQTGTVVPANNDNTVPNTAAHRATTTSGHSSPAAHNNPGANSASTTGNSQTPQNQANTSITTARQRAAAANHAVTASNTPGNTGVSGKLSTASVNNNANNTTQNKHNNHTGTQQQSTAIIGNTNTSDVNGIGTTSNKNNNATPATTVLHSGSSVATNKGATAKNATASGHTIQQAGQQNNKSNHPSGAATTKATLQPASGNTGATAAAISKGTVTGKDNAKVQPGNTAEKATAAKANTGDRNATESVTAGTSTAGTNPTTRIRDSVNAIKIINRTEVSKTPARTPVYSSDTIGIGKVAVPEVPATAAQPGQESGNSTAAASNTANSATMSRKAKRNSMRVAAANNKKAAQATANNTQQDPNTLAANSAAPNTTTPAGNAAVTAPNSATATTANSTVVKKKKHSDAFAFIRNIHWDEVKDNVKYDIGHAQFYMGVAGGANYSVSNNNSFTGFQFGATGELVFNKHLSLMGELKYFNRSGARKMVDDSYVKEMARPDSSSASVNYFTVFTDSSHRYFNFSTLHSFEMPVTLRYAIRKFYLMTGINLAYYLGVNVEEIGTKYTLPSKSISINAGQPILRDTRELDINDFGSRFAMGYVFGAGYQVSPSVQVDLRIVNTFWDNAGSSGAKHLSKDFYKIPSIQLTIGYQFNRGEKTRPGFGPNSQP